MTWIVEYEKPPFRGIKPVEYEDAENALHHMGFRLKEGHIVRGVYEQKAIDSKERDHKTPAEEEKPFTSDEITAVLAGMHRVAKDVQ